MIYCFDVAESQTESIANRAGCADLLYIMSQSYPDIANELKHILQDFQESNQASKGLKNKAVNLTVQLNRNTKRL